MFGLFLDCDSEGLLVVESRRAARSVQNVILDLSLLRLCHYSKPNDIIFHSGMLE